MSKRIVIEWTRTTLCVAVADGLEGRSRLQAIHSTPLDPAMDAGEALRLLLQKTKTAGVQVIGVIPREQVITRLVKFPTTDPDELAQMVELYARAQLPYPREQTVVNFEVLTRDQGFSTVAIVVVQREVIERHLAMLRRAGLSPGLLTLSSWGVLEWFRRIPEGGKDRAAHEPVLVINVDDARTDFVLIREGRIVSSRSLGQGVHDWENPAETIELLLLEVERSRTAIQKELPGVEVRSLLLTGLGELTPWSEQLTQRLGLPVRVVEAQQLLISGVGSMGIPISPVVVGGAALADPKKLFNLNPPEIRMQVRHSQQVRELVVVGMLLIGVFALGAAILALQGYRERRQVDQLNLRIAEIEPTAQAMQKKTRSTNLVGLVLAHRRQLAAHLAGVFRNTPPGVTLEGLTFERARGEVVLRGHAASNQTVLQYIAQLEGLEGVGRVRLKYSRRRAGAAGERTDFELVLHQETAG